MSVWNKLKQGKTLRLGDINQPIVPDEISERLHLPSFVDLLPVKHYAGKGVFHFRDGGLGALLKIEQVSLEAVSRQDKENILDDIIFLFKNVIPCEYQDFWLSQIFLVKTHAHKDVMQKITKYCKLDTKFTQNWIKQTSDHLQDLSNQNSAFFDKNTGEKWIPTKIDVYFCFWQENKNVIKNKEKVFNQIQDIIAKIKNTGIKTNTLNAQSYIELIGLFFHYEQINYQYNALNVLDEDLTQIALNHANVSAKDGIWNFEHKGLNKYCAFMPLEKITRKIQIGHLSSEQRNKGALIDRLPIGSIWTQVIVHTHSDLIQEQLDNIIKKSLGIEDEVASNSNVAKEAKKTLAEGDLIFRFAAGVYLFDTTQKKLKDSIRKIKTIMETQGLEVLDLKNNPLAQDDFIRALPFTFNYEHDQRFFAKRAFLKHVSEIAALSPLYGRATGTGSAGLLYFNRSGEPILFDPLADRQKNAFGLIFGPMGSGKSAFLVHFLKQMIAVYRPRVFIVEKGDSFGLLIEHCKALGLTTNRVAIKTNSKENIALPPFVDAIKLLDKNLDDDRDILGEMSIIAKLMITGGEANEEQKFERSHWSILADAIILAAKNTKKAKREITLTEDIINALELLSKKTSFSKEKKETISKMADSMRVFINTKFTSRIFNTEGEMFPDVDITQFDVGILGDEGYQDKLAVGFTALMSNINRLVEKNQYQDRPTLILVDEAHLITTNPLLAPYIVKITKMWRKLGAWLWLATQSLEDYSDESKQMLKTMEWWICLSMSKAEAKELVKLKGLTKQQEELLVSAHKSPGEYTEGVVFSDILNILIRIIPTPLALALAMTEKQEKAQRKKMMDKDCIDELTAVKIMAQQISQRRRGL